MKVVPKPEVLLFFYQKKKKASSITEADLSNTFKNASKSVYTSTVAGFPDTLCLTPSTSSAMMTPEDTKQDPDDPTPADKGDIHMEYSSHWLCTPSTGAVIKN